MPVESRIADIDLAALSAGRTYHPSPMAWEDEILYFLMLDRFSDRMTSDAPPSDRAKPRFGTEASTSTPRFDPCSSS